MTFIVTPIKPRTKYGKLTVIGIGESHVTPSGKVCYTSVCECVCGVLVTVHNGILKQGDTSACKSCSSTTHGHKKKGKVSREYQSWQDMLKRCYSKNFRQYDDYGGRGIAVCTMWQLSFEVFFRDMGKCPEGMTLDRIDNEKGYSKENCKWSTRSEQNKNQRPRRRKDV